MRMECKLKFFEAQNVIVIHFVPFHHHHQIMTGKCERRMRVEEKDGRKGKKVEIGKKP